jgi:hypothetical protein
MGDVTLPLRPADARRFIDAVLTTGTVLLSHHAVEEMEKTTSIWVMP